jgi:ribosomal protein S18 acetylase RimI-like enzyme
MDKETILPISIPEYSVRRLKPDDAAFLQPLFDRCPDYADMVEGTGVSPTAAQELFQVLPSGGSFADKFVFGFFKPTEEIAGVLEGMRHFPDENIWWIGLLLLAPEVRDRGVGRNIVEDFVNRVRGHRGRAVMLGVVEDNRRAFRFWSQNGFEMMRKTEPRVFGKKRQSVFVMRYWIR